MKPKTKVLLISIIIIFILTIFIGTSYSLWQTINTQDDVNMATTKCFNVEITSEKNSITLENAYPITNEKGKKLTPYSFTITNTCDVFASYQVNLESLKSTTLASKFLDVMINNEEIKKLSEYENTDTVNNGSIESHILAKGSLGSGDSVDYTLRLWIDYDTTMEDLDNETKSLKSKIVVISQPSSWSPVSSGYDTLHDAILANEYQTSPEVAIKKIEAKGEPNLENTSPIIEWKEKVGNKVDKTIVKPALSSINIDSETSGLKEYDTKMWICKKYKLDTSLGKYELSDCDIYDPTELDFSNGDNYYFSAEGTLYNNSAKKIYTSYNFSYYEVYKINGAKKENSVAIWNNKEYASISYFLDCTALISTELESDKSDKGLYSADDINGTSYYFRGNIKNNNLYFAGYYWQIIRINGDGSIRLLYNGTDKGAQKINQGINKRLYQFNKNANKPLYSGYMYGNPDATNYQEAYSNINNSDIKNIIDSWYKENLEEKFSIYISNDNGFCGDRSLISGNGIDLNTDNLFHTIIKAENNIATLKCNDLSGNFLTNDYYTTKNSGIGNKSLDFPIGLISADELLLSGQNISKVNKLVWSYSSEDYWAISPFRYLAAYKSTTVSNARKIGVNNSNDVNYTAMIRPVINLKADVKITGGIGTINDPFVVKTK